MPIRVALVEDFDDIRIQVVDRLNAEPDIDCVGAYGAAENLVACIHSIRPDVVLMSIGLPGQDGISCVQQLKPFYPEVEFLMFTAQESWVLQAMQAGATGYILKPESPVDAVRKVMAGGLPMSLLAARSVIDFYWAIERT